MCGLVASREPISNRTKMILVMLMIMMMFVRVTIIELSHDGRDALVLMVLFAAMQLGITCRSVF